MADLKSRLELLKEFDAAPPRMFADSDTEFTTHCKFAGSSPTARALRQGGER